MSKSYPYSVEILYPETEEKAAVWWPVSSDEDDGMIIGDGIPGDKKTADLCARCSNIVYRQAIGDVNELFFNQGMDVKALLNELLK